MEYTSTKRQHILPAEIIGQFSAQSTEIRPRKRLVQVLRIGTEDCLSQTAESFFYANDHFTLGKDTDVANDTLDKYEIDKLWTIPEHGFVNWFQSFTKTRNTNGKARVPYIDFCMCIELCTQILVRSDSFDKNFGMRMERILGKDSTYNTQDNLNEARLMEIQRIRPLLLYSDMHIVHAPQGTEYVNNNHGFTITGPNGKPQGVLIPISNSMLLVFNFLTREEDYERNSLLKRRKYDPLKGSVSINVIHDTKQNVERTNNSLAMVANQFIFGNTREDLIKLKDKLNQPFSEVSGFADIYGLWAGNAENAEILGQIAIEHESDYEKLYGSDVLAAVSPVIRV